MAEIGAGHFERARPCSAERNGYLDLPGTCAGSQVRVHPHRHGDARAGRPRTSEQRPAEDLESARMHARPLTQALPTRPNVWVTKVPARGKACR